MEYTFFDGLIDSVFVVGPDREVIYCNEAAAKLCDSSVKRLARRKPIFDFIEFSNKNLFIMPAGSVGLTEPAPYQEIEFTLKSNAKRGKVQLAIQPFKEPSGEKRWVVIARDVTIEEVLHAKYHKQLEEKESYIQQLQDARRKLEDYSKNLEQMVETRTHEVKSANVMLNAIMNSLGQGFFGFDSNGDCLDFYTLACRDILEAAPAKQKVWDVLKVPTKERPTFNMWMKAVFSESLPFDSLRELGPSQFQHSQGRHIHLEYFPIRDDAGAIRNIVVVATDRTSEVLANQALEREKKFAKMIVKLVTNRRQFTQFLKSAAQSIDQIRATTFDEEERKALYRTLHTLEGEAGIHSVQELWVGARKCQQALQLIDKTEFDKSLSEMRAQYEQFLSANRNLFRSLGVLEVDEQIEISRGEVKMLLRRFEKMGLEQKYRDVLVEQLEKEPVARLLSHYESALQLLSAKLEKKLAPLKIIGGEHRVFAEPYKNLFSSFIHLFRNCIDHGIELPEVRIAAGKPEDGHIEIRIEPFSRGNDAWMRIRISDDGAGIPPEILPRVFESGFSTRKEVGEFSGRGVGMNVIAVEAETLGGSARIESAVGKGTAVIIEVPDVRHIASYRAAA